MSSLLETIPHCDIFKPNISEFKDFEKCVESCEKKATSGIMKVNIY